jgi:hypothetical protein
MVMALIGYARVSTAQQNLDLQLTACPAADTAWTLADNGGSGPRWIALSCQGLGQAGDRVGDGRKLTPSRHYGSVFDRHRHYSGVWVAGQALAGGPSAC